MNHPTPWTVKPMKSSGKPKIVDAKGRMVMRFNDNNKNADALAEEVVRHWNSESEKEADA